MTSSLKQFQNFKVIGKRKRYLHDIKIWSTLLFDPFILYVSWKCADILIRKWIDFKHDFKRLRLIIEHAWLPINWGTLTVLEVKMQALSSILSQPDFQKMKLKIVKLFNNIWQFCLTWNQITFIISISRVQALKNKSMPQYFGKNKEEIAKGTCVEDLKYRLFYAVPTLSH